MVQALPKPLTLEAFLQLPETKPASEYIDGQISQKPMSQGKHSAIQGDLVPSINQVLRPDCDGTFHITEKMYVKQVGKLMGFAGNDIDEIMTTAG